MKIDRKRPLTDSDIKLIERMIENGYGTDRIRGLLKLDSYYWCYLKKQDERVINALMTKYYRNKRGSWVKKCQPSSWY